MFQSSAFLSLLLYTVVPIIAQTPPGFIPSAKQSLNITYGTNNVSPAGELIPRSETANPPSISTPIYQNASSGGRSIIFLIDHDVPRNGSRVTLLHWFVPNVTVASDGGLTLDIPVPGVGQTSGAPYLQPSPPAGDNPHTYTFLLFSQAPNFTVPSEFASINPPADSNARIGFNLSSFAKAAGLAALLAANYMQVQNLTGVTGVATTFPPVTATSSPTSSESSGAAPATNTGAGAVLGKNVGLGVLGAAAAAMAALL
ncbi:PEBP-like protein [Mytilinidion resinicola]|uniref:PEBP-like protein n=1 Tax=Mytilinidion resinicola TaxID=574789 RepID=A0A6A6YXL1_9PEZI|nr:PEBP-like protein [Mytilinidion resinicola]KAF2813652.1 PEBP-like protein [Mytilinidion resinicola]